MTSSCARTLELEGHRVGSLPELYYIPEAISPAEERSLLDSIKGSKQAWKVVSGRRLQNLGGLVHKAGLLQAPLPGWLTPLLERLAADTGIYSDAADPGARPNHVLVNAYQPGQGIMPHEDGPLYHPAVAILSLANPAVVRFARKQDSSSGGGDGMAGQLVASVVCQPRSLLIFRGEAYSGCLHGILEAEVENIDGSVVNAAEAGVTVGQRLPRGGERISLTVRRVFKTLSLGLRL